MINGEDCQNLGHTGPCGGWDHGSGEGHGFSWGGPNAYGMDPISHEAGWGFNAQDNRYGVSYGHKGRFGSGFAGWGNLNVGDMLNSDQEIGDGDFEPNHPMVVEQGRGHFDHNSHGHGIGYGFNKGDKSNVPETASKEVLKNINEAIDTEVSNINYEATKLKENADSRLETTSSKTTSDASRGRTEDSHQHDDSNESQLLAVSEIQDAKDTDRYENNSNKASDEKIQVYSKHEIKQPMNMLVKISPELQITSSSTKHTQHAIKKQFSRDVKNKAATRAANEKPVNERRTLYHKKPSF